MVFAITRKVVKESTSETSQQIELEIYFVVYALFHQKKKTKIPAKPNNEFVIWIICIQRISDVSA